MSSGFAACFLALQTAIRCSQQSSSYSSHKDHHSSGTHYTDDEEEEESYNPTRCFNARVEPDSRISSNICFNNCVSVRHYNNYSMAPTILNSRMDLGFSQNTVTEIISENKDEC